MESKERMSGEEEERRGKKTWIRETDGGGGGGQQEKRVGSHWGVGWVVRGSAEVSHGVGRTALQAFVADLQITSRSNN